MTEFFREDLNTPLQPPTVVLAPGVASAPPAAAPSPTLAVCGRWLSPGNTSSLERPLPAGEWEVAWSRPLQVAAPPVGLQASAERILIQFDGRWELVRAKDGEPVAQGKLGRSDLLLASDGETFYLESSRPDALACHSMNDGKQRFNKSLFFSGSFERNHLSILPNGQLAAAGISARIAPHRPPEPVSGAEVWSLGSPPKADGVGVLLNAKRTAVLTHKSRRMLMAQQGAGLVVAVPGAVAFCDAALEPTSVVCGAFASPEWLSVDRAGRVHLVVTEPTGPLAYWLLSPSGELLATLPWSREADGPIALPPLVDHAHRPTLISQQVIRALDAEGKLLWESEPGGTLGGAAVTADGRLLVSASSLVCTYELEGDTVTRKVLATLQGERLSTAPILTDGDRLLVGSQGKLHCLVPKKG